LIRIFTRERPRMARQSKDTKAIFNSVERSKLRSSVFRWMVRHHDTFQEKWNGEKIDWLSVCEELAELGLTDTRGKPATQRNARETWFQARKSVAKARAAAAAKAAVKPPRPVYPSRMSPDLRPANAPPPIPNAPRLGGPPAQQNQLAPRRTDAAQNDGPDPLEQIARLQRIFRERDGRN
jgi:hypothetical protein